MRNLLFAALLGVLAAPSAFAQTTTITASHIASDLTGALLPSGQLCLTPVGAYGAPSGFQANGTQFMAQQACFPVTSGAISGVVVPDTVGISPAGIGYSVVVEDPQGNVLRKFTQAIYPTGTTWSLDAWSPTQSVSIANPTSLTAGVNPPQGRCGTLPALYYSGTISTGISIYSCVNQVWVLVTGTGSGTVSFGTVTAALGFTPVSPSSLSSGLAAIPPIDNAHVLAAIGFTPTSSSDVTTAINAALVAYVPQAGGVTLSGALGESVAPVSPTDLVNKAYVDGLFTSGAPATPTFSPAAGTYTSTQSVALTQAVGAPIMYCTNETGNCTPNIPYGSPVNVTATETICASSVASAGGIVSPISCNTYTITGSGTPTGTGIGTIIAQGSMSDGTISYKTCYTGGSVCTGGVSGTPAVTPTHTTGGNSPSANTGTANAVANFELQIGTTGTFTSALWTHAGGGVGVWPTATNYYHGFWLKVGYPAGPSRIEFDSEAFDSSWDWMFGTQCNSDKNLIQTDNQAPGWTYTSMACGKLFDGNYHHVEFTYHRTLSTDTSCSGAPCECWDTGTIDGVSTAINVCKPATTSTWTGSGAQFQIDGEPTTASGGSPAVYDLWVDSDQFIEGLAASASSPGGGGATSSGTGDLDSFNFDGSSSLPAGLTAVGSPAVSATRSHTTANSLHLPSGLNYVTDAISPVHTLYTRQYVYLNTVNTGIGDSFLRFYHGGSEQFVYFWDTPTQHLTYFDQATGASVTVYSSTFPTGAWHYIETYTKIDPTAGHVTVKLDGTQVYDSGSGPLNTGTATIDTVWFGNIGNTAPTGWDVYQDNVDFDDSNWIGPI